MNGDTLDLPMSCGLQVTPRRRVARQISGAAGVVLHRSHVDHRMIAAHMEGPAATPQGDGCPCRKTPRFIPRLHRDLFAPRHVHRSSHDRARRNHQATILKALHRAFLHAGTLTGNQGALEHPLASTARPDLCPALNLDQVCCQRIPQLSRGFSGLLGALFLHRERHREVVPRVAGQRARAPER